MTNPTDTAAHVYCVSEIRDGVLRRIHGYHATLQGAFDYCEAEERKKPLIDTVRFELFPAPGGEQWLVQVYAGLDAGDWPETSDLVISRHEVADEAPAAPPVSVVSGQTLRDRVAAPAVWVDGHPQLEAIAAAVWEHCRTEDTSLVVDDPRNIAVAALAAVLPPNADRAAELVKQIGLRDYWHQEAMSATARIIELETKLRRLAAEVQQPAVGARQPDTETRPARGDQFEAWLKAQRDEYRQTTGPQWIALDEVLDTYRLHADMGVPLDGHVCEGRVVGDCECLEAPADPQPVQHAPGRAVLCPDCHAKGNAVCMDGEPAAVSSAVPGRSTATNTSEETPRRCAHTDVVYGRCILPIPGHLDCFHERQPIRIDEETDEDSLCGAEYPGDDNFVGQLCGLPKHHFGDHRSDEEIAGLGHAVILRWRNGGGS